MQIRMAVGESTRSHCGERFSAGTQFCSTQPLIITHANALFVVLSVSFRRALGFLSLGLRVRSIPSSSASSFVVLRGIEDVESQSVVRSGAGL